MARDAVAAAPHSAIDSAAHEVRMLGFGLAAGRFLFDYRLPPASDPSGRLSILGPLLRRMAAVGGGTADAVLRVARRRSIRHCCRAHCGA